MSIIRKFKKQHPWVAIDKTPLEDARLSFKARGVMAYLLCKPDDWTVNLNHLTTVSEKDGKEAIQSALKELEKLGYIARYRGRNDKGRITGWELVVFETFDDAIAWRKENPKVELANSPEWAETPETKVQEPAKKKNQRRAKPADGKTQNQVQPDLENPMT
ncbi:hypothetical protein [Floridanema evergladense]|uniref:Replication protein n=1 Tax=Floridaenema evergladense BLCC-F167 TaxID=3153639 RepID=A0ABV4WCX9_9CYAN